MNLSKICKQCRTWRSSHSNGLCHSCHYASVARSKRPYPDIVKLREESDAAFKALEHAFGSLERRIR